MKRLYITLIALVIGTAAFAQQRTITGVHQVDAPHLLSANKVQTVDTITTYRDRATAFYILTAGASGYVLGSNGFTSELGCHYDGLGSTYVTELMVYFVHKEVMGGTADTLTANFYDCSADSMPNNLLGTGMVSVADADTSGFPTFIPINSTGPAIGDFFVSMTYLSASIDDTVAFFSTNPTTQSGGPDGAGEERTRQNTIQNGWLTCGDIWTIGGNPYDADALILPIVDYSPVAVDPYIGSNGVKVYPSYPNPAVDHIRIPYSIDATMNVRLTVMDVRGATVAQMDAGEKESGRHEWLVNTNDLSAGKYYFRLDAGSSVLAGKFMVVK